MNLHNYLYEDRNTGLKKGERQGRDYLFIHGCSINSTFISSKNTYLYMAVLFHLFSNGTFWHALLDVSLWYGNWFTNSSQKRAIHVIIHFHYRAHTNKAQRGT